MKVVTASAEIIVMDDGQTLLKRIETAGRICYKSEDKITNDSAASFISRILSKGHHSVIEHVSCTVHIICDRGVSHEIVRHRLASYSQESTRYVNYSDAKFGKEITVIQPCFWSADSPAYTLWYDAMHHAEQTYLALIEQGSSPQQARSVLPNSTKTEIVITCNLREWRHIFELRCPSSAHPQMREIMLPLLAKMYARTPELFADLYNKFKDDILAQSWKN